MHFSPTRARAQLYCLLLFLLYSTAASAQQVQPQPDGLSVAEQQAVIAQQARQQATERILAAGGVPLEGVIDAEAYIVGPGDVFSVSTGGAIPLQISASVTADGMLIVPEVGSFSVAGMSLAEARKRIGTALQRAYRNVPTNVALARPRQFYVHVSGEVTRPGRHVAVPIARVEDALSAAMEGNNPLQALNLQRQDYLRFDGLPALRNVVLHRQNGDQRVIDLLRYYATGNTDYNPYLRDGDRIYVPTYTNDGEAVFVEYHNREELRRASVPTPTRSSTEIYDYRPGDTVTDLLLVAGGPDLLNETAVVRLLRSSNGPLRARDIDVHAIVAGTEPNVSLEPRDRILITSTSELGGVADIDGLVTHPGTYPIVPGETTLQELVEAAGGIRPDGLLRAAYLVRKGTDEIQDAPLALDDVNAPDARAALVEDQVFKQARLADLSFVSRQYLTRELLQYQRVALDLGNDVSTIPPVSLRDGDRFVVPRDPNAVLVIGQVRNPGFVPFVAGADAEYYIEQAGGRSPAAAETYLREAKSGALWAPTGANLQSGDTIFVDRSPTADTESLQSLALQQQQLDFQQERERRNNRFQYVQTGLAVLGTALSVVTTYLLITRESN